MKSSEAKRHPLRQLYIAGFFFAIQTSLTAYINSSFLEQFLNTKFIGILFIVGSFITFISLLNIPKLIKKRGNYKTISMLLLLNIISLSVLSTSSNSIVILISFVIYLVLTSLIIFEMDIFVEKFSKNNSTGSIRGIFLTIKNLAWLFTPLIAGYVVDKFSYIGNYQIGIILSFIVLLIFYFSFRDSNFNKKIEVHPIKSTFKKIIKNKNLWGVFGVSFILQFFYAFMVIYTPIYLHEYIGFNWVELGLMFALLHIPFVLLEYPIGRLADKKWGEKEMMNIGLVIMGIMAIVYSIPTEANLFVWIIIMIITRIGASLVESTTESYFFKQVNEKYTDLISFQRNSRPVAYMVAPLMVSIFLIFFNLRYIYIMLGIVIFCGLFFGLKIKDTK